MSPDPGRHVALAHEQVRFVQRDIFLYRFAPDCMAHECRCLDEEGRVRLDACCQHGCDVDFAEQAAILRRAPEIASVLAPAWRDPGRWFDDSDREIDAEGKTWIRVGVAGKDEASGCVFLQHDRRGCALHRAALEHGFQPAEIKPMVCRLYPLSLYEGILGLSDDFARYSCSTTSGPILYRLLRPVLGDLFGRELLALLDRAERSVRRKHLPIVAYP